MREGALTTLGLAMLLVAIVPTVAPGQARVVVTAQELIKSGHRIDVVAGTEVVWSDPHFDRVWFPSRGEAPAVERTGQGFRAVFPKPGTYRGAFTITGGHRSDDVYPLIVTVTAGPGR